MNTVSAVACEGLCEFARELMHGPPDSTQNRIPNSAPLRQDQRALLR